MLIAHDDFGSPALYEVLRRVRFERDLLGKVLEEDNGNSLNLLEADLMVANGDR